MEQVLIVSIWFFYTLLNVAKEEDQESDFDSIEMPFGSKCWITYLLILMHLRKINSGTLHVHRRTGLWKWISSL